MIRPKNTYIPRVASEIFETAIMKPDECVLFIKAATENGSDLNKAYEDMKMIDDLLHAKHIHFAVHGYIKTTASGNLRKGTDLYSTFNKIIEGRVLENKSQ